MIRTHKNQSVHTHRFAMVPRADIPRSSYNIQKAYKTTFDANFLVPIFCEEVLPGDSFSVRATMFARLATPLFPLMDNLYLESFFFFVPNRIVWTHWVNFMGEQNQPGDSIVFSVPTITSPVGGFAVSGIYDYLGLPTVGQVGGGNTITINALPLRGYNLIYNQWFRDENLAASQNTHTDDGPDPAVDYALWTRGKRKDYFTGCLPWPQKSPSGALAAPFITGQATVKGSVSTLISGAANGVSWSNTDGTGLAGNFLIGTTGGTMSTSTTAFPGLTKNIYPNNLYADLSTATGNTINALRQSFQVQRLLERDARGGTRYTEIVRSHFGVISPDARLQRPEYLGGGTTPIVVSPIAQTSATGVTGGNTPLGTLGAMGTMLSTGHGFSGSFTEHGYILGIINVRADMTYQQGLRKMWSRSTRYDFYFPAFAHLGEQAVLTKEIYADGSANDALVFGYQERWAEYRYSPSQITGLFRSTSAGTIDGWHLAQKFTAAPLLNETFIREAVPLSRVLAVGAGANGQQLILDSFWNMRVARPMPTFSIPGLADHF